MHKPPSKPSLTSQDFVMSQLSSTDMPSDLFSLPLISKLDHLVIKNFKSFSTHLFYFRVRNLHRPFPQIYKHHWPQWLGKVECFGRPDVLSLWLKFKAQFLPAPWVHKPRKSRIVQGHEQEEKNLLSDCSIHSGRWQKDGTQEGTGPWQQRDLLHQ